MAYVVAASSCKSWLMFRFLFHLTHGAAIVRDEDDLSMFEATLPRALDNSRECALYASSHRYSEIPLKISTVCRDIHGALTGPKARRRADVDERAIEIAWNSLDRLWRDLDDLRHNGMGGLLEMEDVERYIHGWQVRISSASLDVSHGLLYQPPCCRFSSFNAVSLPAPPLFTCLYQPLFFSLL